MIDWLPNFNSEHIPRFDFSEHFDIRLSRIAFQSSLSRICFGFCFTNQYEKTIPKIYYEKPNTKI